jgi:hypothetical protein
MSRLRLPFLTLVFWSSVAAAQIAPLPASPGAPVPGPQPPSRDTSATTGTARIRGHVFDATGAPLRKAQVRANSPELRENRLATTDASGAYEIKDLPAGRYNLNASKGSFVALQYGQTRPFEPGRPLQINNAQTVEKIDFSLPRGGIITGRVLDELGEATPDVQVMAMRYQYVQGRRQLSPAGRPAVTNDIGEYRIFALPPGQYFLSATSRSLNPLDVASDDRSGYAPTYFPNTANITEAQRITVGVGQTLTDINVALSPTRLARITGIAVDSDGKPLVGANIVMVQVSGFGASVASAAQIRPDGGFTIANVAPGDYKILALSLGGGAGDLVTTDVTVAGEDISNLRLTGVKSSTATGRIILPQGTPSTSLTGLQLVAVSSTPDILNQPGTAHVNDDASFEMKVQPGHRLIRMNPIGPFAGARIKAVRLNGVDMTDSGVEFKPNEDVSGLEIELTTQPSSVSGGVTNARGEAVRDYTVVIFSRDRQRWGFASRYLNGGRPDQDGKYKALNLPGGDYYAIALDYVEQGAGTDPEFLDRVKDRATEFSLNDGETKALDLKLVTGM